jgi:succinate dehydrogenase/fumarate reductase cytochrome b subunit
MTLRRLHRGLAILLGLFLLLHLGNHLAGLFGQEVHLSVQKALRTVYRAPVIEALLLAAVAVQLGLGLMLLARRRRLTLQTVSGAYLALFMVIHVGVVLGSRWQGVETDLAFAAAGLHAPAPWPAVFALYYGLAVAAVFAHLSVPLSRRSPALGRATLAFGTGMALALVALLAGLVTPLTIPPHLIAAFP